MLWLIAILLAILIWCVIGGLDSLNDLQSAIARIERVAASWERSQREAYSEPDSPLDPSPTKEETEQQKRQQLETLHRIDEHQQGFWRELAEREGWQTGRVPCRRLVNDDGPGYEFVISHGNRRYSARVSDAYPHPWHEVRDFLELDAEVRYTLAAERGGGFGPLLIERPDRRIVALPLAEERVAAV